MPEDVNDHVAMGFHGLVSELQRNDVARFDEDQKKQAEQRAALRRATPHQGLNAGELLKKLDGDPEDANRRVQDDLDRIDREAKAAADKSKPEPLLEGCFPPPPVSE
jgi:tRNA U55 pseudouridine synthase TruB